MIGGACGAVASADTDSTKPASSQGGDTSAPATNPTRGPVATIADSLRKQVEAGLQNTVQSVTGTLNSLPSPAQLQAALPKLPAVSFGGTPTVHGTSTFGSTAPTADPTATPVAATPSTATPVTPSTATPSTAAPATAAPALANPLAAATQAAQDAVAPVTNAITAAANSAATTAAGTIASIPAALPVNQIVSGVQDVLASVAGAGVSLSQLPSDLSELLGVSVTSATAATGAVNGHVGGPATVTAPVPPPTWASPLPPILTAAGGGPAASAPVDLARPLDAAAARAERGAASTSAPLLAPHDTGSTDVLSVVEHVIGAFVASVSVTALLAMALPGIGGLIGTCAAGIRVGYRQAKAGAELPDTAISRFVGSGPVGVVRSGSLISLRPRLTRVGQQGISPTEQAPARRLRAVPAGAAEVGLLDKAV